MHFCNVAFFASFLLYTHRIGYSFHVFNHFEHKMFEMQHGKGIHLCLLYIVLYLLLGFLTCAANEEEREEVLKILKNFHLKSKYSSSHVVYFQGVVHEIDGKLIEAPDAANKTDDKNGEPTEKPDADNTIDSKNGEPTEAPGAEDEDHGEESEPIEEPDADYEEDDYENSESSEYAEPDEIIEVYGKTVIN